MDLLYNTAWLCAAKRRKAHAKIEPDGLPSTPSGASRLLLALAVIGVIVGLLGQAASTIPDRQVIASTTMPSHLGAPK